MTKKKKTTETQPEIDVIETEAIITPTPGGVGPVTVATLLNNILIVANNKK